MKFSIITPVYNTEKYLSACIESVLTQTYQNFELILVDDGSTDNSGDICDIYAEKYRSIYSYHKTNSGQLDTRQYGIRRACGEYLVFLDSDDELKADALEVIYRTVCRTHCDCIVYGMDRVRDGVVYERTSEPEEIIITDKRELYRKCFFSSQYNPLCRKAIKATLFSDKDYSQFFYIRHGEDLLHSIEVLENATSVTFIPDVLYNYTMNPSSVTQTIEYKNYRVDFTVRQKILEFLREQAAFTATDFEEYRNYCIHLLVDQIAQIAGFRTGFKNKIRLFNEIRESTYYRDFLAPESFDRKNVTTRKEFLFLLFRCKYDRCLMLALKTYFLLR